MAAGAAEPLMLLRLLSRITLAPVAIARVKRPMDYILIFKRHHIQAEPNIKSDCEENITIVRDIGRDETHRSEFMTRRKRFKRAASTRRCIW
jgi:hypothetical protein